MTRWQNVLSEKSSSLTSNVVCKQLGYLKAFNELSLPPKDGVGVSAECKGWESRLKDCSLKHRSNSSLSLLQVSCGKKLRVDTCIVHLRLHESHFLAPFLKRAIITTCHVHLGYR